MIRKQQWAQGQHPSQGGTTFATETTSSQLLQNASEKGYTRLRGNTRDSCRSRISLIHKVNRNKFDFKTNLRTRGVEKIYSIPVFFKVGVTYRRLACEQALLFGRVKRRVSRERSSERRSREGQRKGKRPFFGMSRNVHAKIRPLRGRLHLQPHWKTNRCRCSPPFCNKKTLKWKASDRVFLMFGAIV